MSELYRSEGCPHCGKVRDELGDVGASYAIHDPSLPGKQGGDVTNGQTHTGMTELDGPGQIPYLVDATGDEALYESDDIVEEQRHRGLPGGARSLGFSRSTTPGLSVFEPVYESSRS